jgi:3-oxoadipate enol-lactonase/4-carboxymuconolactone decarboxylase
MVEIALSELGGPSDGPVLLVGPSLGTDVRRLWSPVVPLLGDRWRVVGWDLPGHGSSPAATGFSLSDVADELLDLLPGRFAYAGVSAGGAVGLELVLTAPERITSAALICTGARIGTPGAWHERADLVELEGTAAVAAGSAARWFAPGFTDGGELLGALLAVDPSGYAAVCRALAAHDLRDRLAEVAVPLLTVAGARDLATPVETLAEIASGAPAAELVVIDGVAHLPTVEAPARVAALLAGFLPA